MKNRYKILNLQIPEEKYLALQNLAAQKFGLCFASFTRTLLYDQLKKDSASAQDSTSKADAGLELSNQNEEG